MSECASEWVSEGLNADCTILTAAPGGSKGEQAGHLGIEGISEA